MRCRHSGQFGRGIGRKIAHLARAAREIEQLFAGIARVEDVFVARIGRRVPLILARVAHAVFEVEKAAPG